MTSCTEFELLISQALDQELSEEEAAMLAGHLQTCAACRSLQVELAAIHQDMALLCAEPPAGLIRKTLDRLEALPAEEAAAPKRKTQKSLYRKWIASAAVFAIVVSAAVLSGKLIPLTPDPAVPEEASLDTGMEQRADVQTNTANGTDLQSKEDSPPAQEITASQEAALSSGLEGNAAASHADVKNHSVLEPADGAESASPVRASPEGPPESASAVQDQAPATFGLEEDGAAVQVLSEQAASDLLASYLKEQQSEAVLSALTYTGLTADGSRYRFQAVYEDEATSYYEVNLSDSSITQVSAPEEQMSSPEP